MDDYLREGVMIRFEKRTVWIAPAAFGLACFISLSAWGQASVSQMAGDFKGSLGSLHLVLHIAVDGSGKMSGALDSLDQGAMGLLCSDFSLQGADFSFAVPAVHGTWKGTVSGDGKTLTGTWNQGTPLPLVFTRDATREPFVPAGKPSAVDGIWLGTLQAGATALRVQLTVKSNQAGEEFCTGDSLDQQAMGMECANVKFAGGSFSFDVPSVHGSWEGKLGSDGNSLTGTWTQGSPAAFELCAASGRDCASAASSHGL